MKKKNILKKLIKHRENRVVFAAFIRFDIGFGVHQVILFPKGFRTLEQPHCAFICVGEWTKEFSVTLGT